jgi:hypothetical protein
MHQSPSPVFDSPELLTLRRMKPLPKRRRTSSESSHEDLISPPDVPTEDREPPPDPLSSQLALQSYYMPILGGMQELFKHEYNPNKTVLSLDFGGVVRNAVARAQEDDAGNVDYPDHAHQPGNTKKRKVPANLGATGQTHDSGDGSDLGEDEVIDRAIPTGRPEHEYDSASTLYAQGALSVASGTGLTTDSRKIKVSRATLAGLAHKEMLKTRKRQLATVLGALTHGDTLALDQALSANYPFASSGIAADLQSRDLVRVRLSRRRAARLARAYKAFHVSLPQGTQPPPFVDREFTFVVPSASE